MVTGAMRLTVICQPRDDQPFRAFVEHNLALLAPRATGLDLQQRLRIVYPLAVVRPVGPLRSYASGQVVRYAYRDGDVRADEDAKWWTEPGVASGRFDQQGIYRSANEAFLAIFGVSDEADLIGHSWAEFATPESVAEADGIWKDLHAQSVLPYIPISSTYAIARPDGSVLPIEYRTERDEATGMYHTWMRPATMARS